MSSACCFEIDSFIIFGNEFVNSFASFNPNNVTSRKIRNIAKRFDLSSSPGIDSRITSKVSCFVSIC